MLPAAPVVWPTGVVAGLNRSPLAPVAERIAFNKSQLPWGLPAQYQTPDCFRDAKLGLWGHWGPQCQPEHGDWYARETHMEGRDKYNLHVRNYGEQERAIVEGIAAWIQPNSESIYGTRPRKIFGKRPAQANASQLSAQGFNESKNNSLYANAMGWPVVDRLLITALAAGNQRYS